jgi:hypothetical protein
LLAIKHGNEEEIARLILSGTSFTTEFKGITALKLAKMLNIDLREIIERYYTSIKATTHITPKEKDLIVREVIYGFQQLEYSIRSVEHIPDAPKGQHVLKDIQATPVNPPQHEINK